MSDLRDYDKVVTGDCGRMTLLQQAQSGYTSMGEFESAFYGLYESPEMQRKFGVEELAFMKSKPSSVLNHMMTDHRVSEGAVNFGNGINPDIEEGVFVRNRPIFSKDSGEFNMPSIDSTDPKDEEMLKLKAGMNRMETTQRLLVEQQNREMALREADKINAEDLKRWADRTMDKAGMKGRGLSKDTLRRSGYDKTSTEIKQMPGAESREYIIDRFFGNDPQALLNWVESTRESQGDRILPSPRKDLMEAFAEVEEEPALVPQPPTEPRGAEPESPRAAGMSPFDPMGASGSA